MIVLFCVKMGIMTLIIEPQPVPLRKNPDGSWRIGNSRVLLDLVIHAFNAGRTPEEIVQSYDSVQLEEIYAVVTYYLTHRHEVNAYLQQQEAEAETLWKDIRNRSDYQEFRNRLLARRANNHL